MRDGRFIDFDVFSNTQAETFGAKVTGFSTTKTNGILAVVDVEFGLSGRSSGTPNRLLYEMNQDSQGRWRINNITYLHESGFQLRSYLRKLLNPAL